MARSKMGTSVTDYSTKAESEEVPVAPCQGWTDACEFCDKRFCNWVDGTDEELEKIPTKPGIFMIALKNKGVTEVVDIVLEKSDVQKAAFSSIENVRERVADKKSKATKSVVLCRWMNFKQSSDKDVINLCAHWFNNGVLPKFVNSWPGSDVLERTDILTFSERLQKWCYPKKEAFWRKPKGPLTKIAEVVDGCNWSEQCEICDANFSQWVNVDDAVYNDLIPEGLGIYMLSVRCGKNREIVNICYDANDIKLSIKHHLQNTHKALNYVLKNKKFANKNAVFQVRWMMMNDVENDNCCFSYAHWLNTGTLPMMSYRLPGQELVEKNKNFIMRTHDKMWCYEIENFKQLRGSKMKNKKQIMDDLEDDYRNFHCSEDR